MVISQISQKNIETPDKAKEIFEDFIKEKQIQSFFKFMKETFQGF